MKNNKKKYPSHRVLSSTLDLVMRPLYHYRQKIIPLATGKVLEIGVGTGLNLPLYSKQTTVIGIEPDLSMLEKAQQRTHSADVKLHQQWAEDLDFADQSFDTVVITFTLCTIADPAKALAECHRVLKNDGTFLFAEHVCSNRSWLSQTQQLMTPLWKKVAGGCHLDRHAEACIENADFKIQQLNRCSDSYFSLLPIIYGSATKITADAK